MTSLPVDPSAMMRSTTIVPPGPGFAGVGDEWSDRDYRAETVAGAAGAVPGGFDDRSRRHDRERRVAVDSRGSRILGGLSGLGGQHLHADLRWVLASRRADGGLLRPPSPVLDRPDCIHLRLARLWSGHIGGVSGRGACDAGPRWGGRIGGLAVVDHDHVH